MARICSAVSAVPQEATTSVTPACEAPIDIHVAFHQNDPVELHGRFFGAVQVIKNVRFPVDLRFRRIEILRLVFGIERAAAERDHFAGFVLDREHQPVAEAVVERSVVALAHQPRKLPLLRLESALLQNPQQRRAPSHRRAPDRIAAPTASVTPRFARYARAAVAVRARQGSSGNDRPRSRAFHRARPAAGFLRRSRATASAARCRADRRAS